MSGSHDPDGGASGCDPEGCGSKPDCHPYWKVLLYKIDEIHYRNIFGQLLWREKMIFSRLHAIDEELVEDHKTYIVKRVAVADNVQHVNVQVAEME